MVSGRAPVRQQRHQGPGPAARQGPGGSCWP